MYTAYPPCSFSSSPPSSPSICAVDTSPPSSPEPELIIVDPPMHLAHPFAASVKANRAPPQHEMKTSVIPISPDTSSSNLSPEPPKKKYRVAENMPEEFEKDEYISEESSSFFYPSQTPEDREMEIWDFAISKVVDAGHGAVILGDQNLTYIPSKIEELAHFVAIPETFEQINASRALLAPQGRLFTRVTTAPPSTSLFMSRSFASGRTKSIADASLGLAREQLQLFLAGNKIQRLPRELFALEKMTVLILRANQLTSIPPEIVRLTGLRELNVSSNRLRYLPSEMLSMSLNQLHLHPNPFIPSPPPPPPRDRVGFPPAGCQVSPTTHRPSRVTPLVELCFRVLMSEYHTTTHDHDKCAPPEPKSTVLTTGYPLPLHGWPIPQPLKVILDTCVPGSIPISTHSSLLGRNQHTTEDREITGISVCPSPRHGGDRKVFVRHAEERYTWERGVAGVSVGGAVPVLWRGCQWGCLDFLDQPEPEARQEVPADVNESRDTEMRDAEVVQLVRFASEELDDFGD